VSKRLLMIAFHYPPCHGSSGLQRTLAFSRYLRNHDWQPALLTVTSGAYESTSESLLSSIPTGMPIHRVWTLDTARHLSIFGRYPSRLAVPDRWASWRWGAIRKALKLVRELRPDAIWSTYPIATAHSIAASVAEQSGLPWIADMRDPMVELDPYTGIEFPEDPAVRKARLEIESRVMRLASRVVFCTEGARNICVDRYGTECESKFSIISNGYDEDAFQSVGTSPPTEPADRAFTLLHSGTVYPGSDRGPEGLFEAIHALNASDQLPGGFRIVFRASGHDDYLNHLARQFAISSLVRLEPQVDYRSALQEMMSCSALLVIQGPSSNPAIPAKLYEYFRARKPLFGLVHPAGETAGLLERLNAGVTAAPDDPAAIASALRTFFARIREGQVVNVSEDDLPRFSREYQTGELAMILDNL
jgi:glycosyltransferase involved in cell wall biosynthesis